MSFYLIIFWLSCIVAIASIFKLLRSYKSLPTSLKALVFLLIALVGFQLLNSFSIMLGNPNPLIYKIALPTYYIITWAVFLNLISTKSVRIISNIILGSGLLGIGLIYIQQFNNHNLLGDSILVQNIVFVFVSFLYFFNMLKEVSVVPLKDQWQFFVVTGFFSYSLISTAVWMSHKIGLNLEDYPYAIRNVNGLTFLAEMIEFFWAIRIFFQKEKLPK